MTLPVVILAGGLATRLRPITAAIPKSLLEIGGQPFIFHQLQLLQRRGIRKVLLLVGYLGEQIEAIVGDGAPWRVDVTYFYDGPVLLGTAGAIAKALPLLPDEFFVLNGDSYLECDYAEVTQAFHSSGRSGLMTVFENNNKWDISNVYFRYGAIVTYDKSARSAEMKHVDYGLSVFRKSVFQHIELSKPTDLSSVYQHLIRNNDLAGYEIFSRFFEVGSYGGIRDFGEMLRSQQSASGK